MIRIGLLAAAISGWVPTAEAEELSITVDEPIVCFTIKAVLDVHQYYREGGFELANAWADYSSDCVRLGPTEVPVDVTKAFIMFEEGTDLKYGYIPIGMGHIVALYMYFMTIKGDGVPT